MPGLIQRGFAGGEIAPSLISRTDTAKLQSGLYRCRNFTVTKTGSARKMTGLRYIVTPKEQTANVRALPFRFNDDQTYVIEAGTNYFRLVRNGAQVYSNETLEGTTPAEGPLTLYLWDIADGLPAYDQDIFSGPFSSHELQGQARTSSGSAAPVYQVTGPGDNTTYLFSFSYAPGDADRWVTGSYTVDVNVLLDAAAHTSLSCDVKLHRVNASGVSQEEVDSNEGSVNVSALGVFQWTFTDIAWAGPVLDTDYFVITLAFSKTGGASGFFAFEARAQNSKAVTSIFAVPAFSWVDETEYVPGDVVFLPKIAEYGYKWYLGDEVPAFTGTSPASPSDEQPHASLFETIPTTGTVPFGIPAASTEVTSFIVNPQGVPGWDDWLATTAAKVSIVVANPSGAGPCVMRVNLQRIDAAGNIEESGIETDDQTITAGGTFVFYTSPPIGGWGTLGDAPAATDSLRLRVRIQNTGGAAFSGDIATGDVDSYVVVYEAPDPAGGLDYFYCVATHSDRSPGIVNYHDDFWYPQPEDVDGNPILEIPTPYAGADVPAIKHTASQSADIVTLTSRGYPPHELIRRSNVQWSMLPIRLGPTTSVPTAITNQDDGDGPAGGHTLRYAVTAIDRASGNESLPGADAASAKTDKPITDASATSTDTDLVVESVSHGLADGDQIIITLVETVDADRSNENAVLMLQDLIFTVTSLGDDSFSLNETAGLLTIPVLAGIDGDDYPSITIDYAKAYIEYLDTKIPTGEGMTRIEISWTGVEGAQEYWVYRSVDGSAFGFIGSSKNTSFSDEGASPGNTIPEQIEADLDSPPMEHTNPFRYGNYPKTSTYYQQRQVFASSDDDPQRAWASAIGDFRNFSTRYPLGDSDALNFRVSGTEVNAINHMLPFGQLILLTSGMIWSARGDADNVLKPSAINLEPLAYEGTADVRPALAGDAVIHLQARSNVIREVRFDLGTGSYSGYAGRDMTIFAGHLFEGYLVTEFDFAPVPDRIVWAIRNDGALLGLTYIPEQDIWAWHLATTRPATDKFISVAVIPEDDQDTAYFVVQRDVDGSTVYYMERLEPWTVNRAGVDHRLEAFFVDSGLTYDGTNTDGATTMTLTGGTFWTVGELGLTLTASAATFPGDGSNVGNGYRLVDANGNEVEVEVTADGSTTVQTVKLLTACPSGLQGVASTTAWVAMVDVISGLDHLEGEEVVACADLVALGPFTVSSGQIDLGDRPYGIVHVGLEKEAYLESLDVDFAESADSPADMYKRVAGATLFLQFSKGVQLGRDADHLAPVKIDGYLDDTALQSGKFRTRFSTGFDRHGRWRVQADGPLPCEVTAWITHVEVTGGR